MAIWQESISNHPAVWRPSKLDEALVLKKTYGEAACYVAGGTLLRTQWESGVLPRVEHLISLESIPELRGIELQVDGSLIIGALTQLAKCTKSDLIETYAHLLGEASRQIAAPSIRNLATLGGNVRFGVGDSIPALLVYDAQLIWLTEHGLSSQSLRSWLKEVKLGTQSKMNILVRIVIPSPEANVENLGPIARQVAFFKKVGRREAFTPSLVTVSLIGTIDVGGNWSKLAMAAGGGAGIAMRLPRSEAWLMEQSYSSAILPGLAEMVTEEVMSYSDPFAAEDYRKLAAGNLLASGCYEALERLTFE